MGVSIVFPSVSELTTLLASYVVSVDTQTVTLTDIPQGYSDILVIGKARVDTVGAVQGLLLKFNDNGFIANYKYIARVMTYATLTATNNLNDTSFYMGGIAAVTAPANVYSSFSLIIHDYYNSITKHKITYESEYFDTTTPGNSRKYNVYGEYPKLEPITRMYFNANSGNAIKANSSFSVYLLGKR